jgi:hypothetical protein
VEAEQCTSGVCVDLNQLWPVVGNMKVVRVENAPLNESVCCGKKAAADNSLVRFDKRLYVLQVVPGQKMRVLAEELRVRERILVERFAVAVRVEVVGFQ